MLRFFFVEFLLANIKIISQGIPRENLNDFDYSLFPHICEFLLFQQRY